jgi:hypothetical protein
VSILLFFCQDHHHTCRIPLSPYGHKHLLSFSVYSLVSPKKTLNPLRHHSPIILFPSEPPWILRSHKRRLPRLRCHGARRIFVRLRRRHLARLPCHCVKRTFIQPSHAWSLGHTHAINLVYDWTCTRQRLLDESILFAIPSDYWLSTTYVSQVNFPTDLHDVLTLVLDGYR